MTLKEILFLNEKHYRIDREGRVYTLKLDVGRARGTVEPKWKRCKSLSLEKAQSLASDSLKYDFPLVEETSEVVLRPCADGSTKATTVPYITARQVRHDPTVPMEDHPVYGAAMRSSVQWVDTCPRLVGDRKAGWYSVETRTGIVHLFHGTTTAAEIFKSIH
jgi:hypothetical protein